MTAAMLMLRKVTFWDYMCQRENIRLCMSFHPTDQKIHFNGISSDDFKRQILCLDFGLNYAFPLKTFNIFLSCMCFHKVFEKVLLSTLLSVWLQTEQYVDF